MYRSIQVILFDLGNTLVYNKYDESVWETLYQRAEDALWTSLHAAGVRASGSDLYGRHETLFHYYYHLRKNDLDEPGIGNVLKRALLEREITVSDEVLKAGLRSMYAVTQANWHVEDDALETVKTLHQQGFRLGVVSNGADDENTYVLLDKTGLRPYFEFILSSATFGRRKPDPGIFQVALSYFKVAPGETVMVGDTLDADIEGANKVGIFSIWITRRAGEGQSLDGQIRPGAQVRRLSEIPALLKPA